MFALNDNNLWMAAMDRIVTDVIIEYIVLSRQDQMNFLMETDNVKTEIIHQ